MTEPSSKKRNRRENVKKEEALPSEGWLVTIKTIAPDGENADACTRDDLSDIIERLGRTVIPEDVEEQDDEDDEDERHDDGEQHDGGEQDDEEEQAD